MNSSQKTKLIIIESGHLSKIAVSGGDKLMREMYPYLQNQYSLELVIPSIALRHWGGKKIKVHSIPGIFLERKISPPTVLLIYLWRIYHTIKHLRKIKEPVIFYSSTNIFVDVLPIFALRLFRKKFFWITRIHHIVEDPTERPGNIIVNLVSFFFDNISLFCIRSSDIIFALNTSLKADLIKSRGFKKNKIEVLGAGINYKKIRSYRILPRTFSYDGVVVGRLHPAKGVYDLPYIWKEVTRRIPNAKLAVIGEVDKKTHATLRQMIETEKLSKNISLLGFLHEKELYSTLKKAKVFLFTDHEAGWGIAVAEAMAAGLSVVGYNLPIFNTVYKKGFVTVPINERGKLAEETINLLQNEKLRKKLALEANKEVKASDWSIVSAQFLTLVCRRANKEN